MAARTRGLKCKDDKENSNIIPSTGASSTRKNCQRCFREITGGTNDVQSRLTFERSGTSSPQLYGQPMDPGLNSRNGMVTPTYHLRTRTPRSTPELKFASNAAVRNASKETQTGGGIRSLHDNARPHAADSMDELLQCFYSLSMSPSDFNLRPLRNHLGGIRSLHDNARPHAADSMDELLQCFYGLSLSPSDFNLRRLRNHLGDSMKQEKTLILECGLDLDYNYTSAPDHRTQLNPSAKEKSLTGRLKKWSLLLAAVVSIASISYILGVHTCQGKPENQLKLPYNPPPNVERLELERNHDIDQLKDLVSDLQEKLSVKMEIYSHQYNILREKMQTISNAVNSIKGNAQNHNSRSTDIDNVCTKKLVEEISTYDADKMGIADYALESSGGSILSTPATQLYSFDSWITIWNIPLWATQRSARNIIQASVHPGDCWAFAGSTGSVVIRLAMPIYITAVTMEHIPPSISPTGNINSAPKTFLLFGLEETYDTEGIRLGQFTYAVPGTPLQTFIIKDQVIEKRISFKAVQLKILTNHGNQQFTCVYRFRVHGKPTSETGFVTS